MLPRSEHPQTGPNKAEEQRQMRTSPAFTIQSSFYLHFTAILLESTTSKVVLCPIENILMLSLFVCRVLARSNALIFLKRSD